MFKLTYTYTDYNGNERTEDCLFNLTEAETIKLEMGELGGMTEKIKRIMQAQDIPEIMKVFDELVGIAYGVKSPDGREFIKSPEITKSFMQSGAYNKLYMDFVTKDGFAANFFNQLIPNTEEVQPVADNIVAMPTTN